MINKKQEKLLKSIKAIWKKYPSLRLCQLIQNCFGTEDIYNITDEILEYKLKECYDIQKKS